MTVQEHLKLMGLRVQDRVTGFAGVVTSIGFDLYGCVQAVVTPPIDSNEKMESEKMESRWFDTKRLIVTDRNPVMELPDFIQVPGGQDKSLMNDR